METASSSVAAGDDDQQEVIYLVVDENQQGQQVTQIVSDGQLLGQQAQIIMQDGKQAVLITEGQHQQVVLLEDEVAPEAVQNALQQGAVQTSVQQPSTSAIPTTVLQSQQPQTILPTTVLEQTVATTTEVPSSSTVNGGQVQYLMADDSGQFINIASQPAAMPAQPQLIVTSSGLMRADAVNKTPKQVTTTVTTGSPSTTAGMTVVRPTLRELVHQTVDSELNKLSAQAAVPETVAMDTETVVSTTQEVEVSSSKDETETIPFADEDRHETQDLVIQEETLGQSEPMVVVEENVTSEITTSEAKTVDVSSNVADSSIMTAQPTLPDLVMQDEDKDESVTSKPEPASSLDAAVPRTVYPGQHTYTQKVASPRSLPSTIKFTPNAAPVKSVAPLRKPPAATTVITVISATQATKKKGPDPAQKIVVGPGSHSKQPIIVSSSPTRQKVELVSSPSRPGTKIVMPTTQQPKIVTPSGLLRPKIVSPASSTKPKIVVPGSQLKIVGPASPSKPKPEVIITKQKQEGPSTDLGKPDAGKSDLGKPDPGKPDPGKPGSMSIAARRERRTSKPTRYYGLTADYEVTPTDIYSSYRKNSESEDDAGKRRAAAAARESIDDSSDFQSADEEQHEVKQKRGRGRPRKSETILVSPGGAESSPKRLITEPISTDDEGPAKVASPVAIRTPVTVKKLAAEDKIPDTIPSVASPIKKGRGRPKKTTSEDESSAPSKSEREETKKPAVTEPLGVETPESGVVPKESPFMVSVDEPTPLELSGELDQSLSAEVPASVTEEPDEPVDDLMENLYGMDDDEIDKFRHVHELNASASDSSPVRSREDIDARNRAVFGDKKKVKKVVGRRSSDGRSKRRSGRQKVDVKYQEMSESDLDSAKETTPRVPLPAAPGVPTEELQQEINDLLNGSVESRLTQPSGSSEDIRTLQSRIDKLQTLNNELRAQLKGKPEDKKFGINIKGMKFSVKKGAGPGTVASMITSPKQGFDKNKQREIELAEAELRARETALEKREFKAKALDREIDERSGQLTVRESRLDRWERKLKSHEKEIEYKEKQLKRFENDIRDLGGSASSRKKDTTDRSKDLSNLEKELDKREADLNNRAKLLEASEQQLFALSSELNVKAEYLQKTKIPTPVASDDETSEVPATSSDKPESSSQELLSSSPPSTPQPARQSRTKRKRGDTEDTPAGNKKSKTDSSSSSQEESTPQPNRRRSKAATTEESKDGTQTSEEKSADAKSDVGSSKEEAGSSKEEAGSDSKEATTELSSGPEGETESSVPAETPKEKKASAPKKQTPATKKAPAKTKPTPAKTPAKSANKQAAGKTKTPKTPVSKAKTPAGKTPTGKSKTPTGKTQTGKFTPKKPTSKTPTAKSKTPTGKTPAGKSKTTAAKTPQTKPKTSSPTKKKTVTQAKTPASAKKPKSPTKPATKSAPKPKAKTPAKAASSGKTSTPKRKRPSDVKSPVPNKKK